MAKQETTKETHTLLPIRPSLEETGLVAYNAATAKKWAAMGLDRPTPEAVAQTDLARLYQAVYFHATRS